jgi:HD-GYP domain-containing protein (c-di-GMP phosphodiesterase class II)
MDAVKIGGFVSFRQQVKQSFTRFIPGSTKPAENISASHQSLPSSLTAENQRLRETNLELLEALGAVVDSLNPFTLFHSSQVAVYGLELARALGLSQAEQERIFRAGLVHDVGMISMSSAAIAQDEKFSEEDYQSLRLHPTIGGEIVGRIQNLRDLAPLVHYHHERFDGAGYPDRLIGEEIPIGARVLALADSLDAMLSERPNRPGHELVNVMREIKRCSGAQFDPAVVNAFFRMVAEKPASFFSSSNQSPTTDMLLSTVGISSGRVKGMLRK